MSPNPNADLEFPEVAIPAEVATSIESVVRFLVGELADLCGLSAELVERITTQVMIRERLGTTGIGRGLAIPHCRVDGIEKFAGVIGHAVAMDWHAIDGEAVRLVCLLIGPPQPATFLRQTERVFRMLRARLDG